MSYADARQNRTWTIGAVAVVHAAMGYALLTGLATDVIRNVVEGPLETYNVKAPTPPPPDPQPLPKPDKAVAHAAERLSAPVREVTILTEGTLTATAIDLAPGPIVEATPGPALDPPAQPTLSLARGVSPRGNQGDWFPADSYPAAARRAGAEGIVSVRVTVGADGRVADCQVTASSGNADLDSTTCRLAKRNGRFQPAKDASGAAVVSSFTLRNVRWRLED